MEPSKPCAPKSVAKRLVTLPPLPISNINYVSTSTWKYEDQRAPLFHGVKKKTEKKYKEYTRLVKQIEHDHPIMCRNMDAYRSIIDSLNKTIEDMLEEVNTSLS